MAHKLDSGKWRHQILLPNGKKQSFTHSLKRTAEKRAADARADYERGRWRDPKVGKVTVREWHDRWWANRIVEQTTADTDRGYLDHDILPYWGDWPLEAITIMEVQGWERRLSERLAPSTVHRIVHLLSSMLKAAVPDVLRSNPCQYVVLPKIIKKAPRYFSDDELDAIAEHMPAPLDTMVLLEGWTGLRWGEAAGLHGTQVNWFRNSVTVADVLTHRRGIRDHPKSEESQREVPVPESVMARMRALMAGRDPSGPVFAGPDGEPLSYQAFYVRWRSALEKAGVPYAKPHVLRHTAASRQVMDGTPLYDVQEQLGHKDPKTTQIYTHLQPDAGGRVSRVYRERGR